MKPESLVAAMFIDQTRSRYQSTLGEAKRGVERRGGGAGFRYSWFVGLTMGCALHVSGGAVRGRSFKIPQAGPGECWSMDATPTLSRGIPWRHEPGFNTEREIRGVWRSVVVRAAAGVLTPFLTVAAQGEFIPEAG